MLATMSLALSEAQGTSNDLDVIRDIFLFSVIGAVLLVNMLRGMPWAQFLVIIVSVWMSFRWFRIFWLVGFDGEPFFAGLLFSSRYLASAGLLCTPSARAWFPPFQMDQVFDPWRSLSRTMRISWGLFVVSLVVIHLSAYGGGGNGLFGLVGAMSGTILFVFYALESFERAYRSERWPSINILLISFSLLVIAIFYPSASLGYLYLVIFPLQMLCAAMLLAGLLKSGWKDPRLPKPYSLTLVFVNIIIFGLLGFIVIQAFVSGIQMH